jgi:type II secretory pathway pseudopilin PulG
VRLIQKSFFTLLEIMIVLSILALVGSVTVFNIRSMYQQQQALNEMDRAVNLIKTASDLMMMVNLDSEVKISSKEGRYQLELIPKSGISPLIAPLLPASPLVLETIDDIEFEDGINNKILKIFSLDFLSKGFLMNRGILSFKSGSTQGYITFLGYPASLPLTIGKPPDYPSDKAIQDLVLKITEQTRLETTPEV